MKAIKDIMPIILGVMTIAAVLIGTGRILERLDGFANRISQLEDRVFGFHK